MAIALKRRTGLLTDETLLQADTTGGRFLIWEKAMLTPAGYRGLGRIENIAGVPVASRRSLAWFEIDWTPSLSMSTYVSGTGVNRRIGWRFRLTLTVTGTSSVIHFSNSASAYGGTRRTAGYPPVVFYNPAWVSKLIDSTSDVTYRMQQQAPLTLASRGQVRWGSWTDAYVGEHSGRSSFRSWTPKFKIGYF